MYETGSAILVIRQVVDSVDVVSAYCAERLAIYFTTVYFTHSTSSAIVSTDFSLQLSGEEPGAVGDPVEQCRLRCAAVDAWGYKE